MKSRRAVLAALTGLLLVAGLSAPAAAGPVGDEQTVVCLRTDSDGKRGGVCVWLPIGR